jgi:ABC-2 type transport system ATP-binding protein
VAVIELTAVQKVVEQNLAIDIEALAVRAGEIVALVGPAGSGKHTLLQLLIGQTRPTAGTVRVAGIDPYIERAQFSRRVGVLFSEDGLYQRQSAQANLIFQCRLHGLAKARAGEILARVGLGDHAKVRVDKLPSGLARRLAFGRAILHDPTVLLLEEPFTNCDKGSLSLLSDLMRQMSGEGATLLILTNDATNLSPLCDTVHILDQGRMVESYQPEEERRAAMPFKIPVRLEGTVALVNPADILFADTEGGRTFLETAEGRLPTQFTLAELEERLSRSGFFRAHRSYLVNLQHVKEVIPYTRNSFSLRLDDPAGTKIPLSKSAAGELRELLDY